MKEIRITSTPQYKGFGYDLRIINHSEKWYAKELIIHTPSGDEMGEVIEPLLHLTKEELQKWLDELWGLGIRPSNGESSIGEIGALKYHLQDMRRLVFEEKQ